MPRLLLVRHAQSENNLSNDRVRALYRGDAQRIRVESERARKADPALSELGWQQAERLADRLAPLLRAPGSVLVTSPMRRALQTAAPLIERAGLSREAVVCEPHLYEVGGCYYMDEAQPSMTPAQIEAEFAARCTWAGEQGWYAGQTGAESDEQARARVERVVAWAERTLASGAHQHVVLIAHGDLLTRWLRRWLGVPWSRSMAFVHANTGITSLMFDAREGLLLESLNDVAHLPDELRSGDGSGWYRYVLPDLQLDQYLGWSAIPAAHTHELVRLRQAAFARDNFEIADYAQSDARSVHVVACAQGRLAGYVQYDPALERLRQLVVEPGHRGSGLGRRLVSAVEDEARRRGREALRVHAWVDSEPFYRGCGFVECGPPVRSAGPERDAGVEWLPMQKLLTPDQLMT